MPTSFDDIRLAFEFVASAQPGLHDAILCRRTGKIYYRSDLIGIDEFEDERPDDDADGENYIAIPDKRDLSLGKPLAQEFLPDDFDDVRYMFSKRGAYSKFKALLMRRHALERWYAFEEKQRTRRCATGARKMRSRSATEAAQDVAASESAPATN